MLRWQTQEFETRPGQFVLVRIAPLVEHYYVEVRRVMAPGVSIPIQPPRLVRRGGVTVLKRLAQFGIKETDAFAWLSQQFGSEIELTPNIKQNDAF